MIDARGENAHISPLRLTGNAKAAIPFTSRRRAPNSGYGRDIFAALKPGSAGLGSPAGYQSGSACFCMRVDEGAGSVGQLLVFALSNGAHLPSNER
jgi:hypothetical protein